MQISTTYIAIAVNFLAYFLPKLGVEVGSDELTTIIQSLIVAGSGIWVLVQRYRKGDVSVLGVRKA